jgi:hypothetical protein
LLVASPSPQTFRKVFCLIGKQALAACFAAWAQSGRSPDGAGPEVMAIDGKMLRGSKAARDGSVALHLISAYATEAGLVLAQRAVDGKSNEITAIPDLLDLLDLEGAIVTIDAIGTQRAIAAKIVEKKADYVLALKGNQSGLRDDVALAFADPALTETFARDSQTDIGHGGSRSDIAASAKLPGSPDAIPDGRACAAPPKSPPSESIRKRASEPARLPSTSRPSRPTPASSCERFSSAEESRTTSIGYWT